MINDDVLPVDEICVGVELSKRLNLRSSSKTLCSDFIEYSICMGLEGLNLKERKLVWKGLDSDRNQALRC